MMLQLPFVKKDGIARQILYSLVIALGHVAMGNIIAFPSVIIADTDENGSNIYGGKLQFSAVQKDMLGSLMGLGALLATIIQSFTTKYFGKRIHMLISGFLGLISWIGVVCYPCAVGILAFRFLSGIFVGCVLIMGANYCVEICESNLRGVFVGLLRFFLLLGMLTNPIFDIWLRYYHVAIVNGIIILFFTLGLLLLPESPKYLVIKGKDDQALKVLSSLRGKEAESLEKEIQSLKELNAEKESKSVWQGLTSPSILKKLFVVFILLFLRTFGGFDIMVSYYNRIFEDFGSNFDVGVASVVLFVVQIPSTLVFSFFIVDRYGRRKALLCSCVVISCSLFYLAAHSYYLSTLATKQGEMVEIISLTSDHPNAGLAIEQYDLHSGSAAWWTYVPIVVVLICLSAFYMGLHVVPFVLMAEYFPTWIRGEASAICGCFFFVFQFGAFQSYTPMVALFTTPGYYLFMSILVALGVPFTFFCVEETMGQDIG